MLPRDPIVLQITRSATRAPERLFFVGRPHGQVFVPRGGGRDNNVLAGVLPAFWKLLDRTRRDVAVHYDSGTCCISPILGSHKVLPQIDDECCRHLVVGRCLMVIALVGPVRHVEREKAGVHFGDKSPDVLPDVGTRQIEAKLPGVFVVRLQYFGIPDSAKWWPVEFSDSGRT